jgi:branched-chain amino acid transport system ATP-binding protein
LALSGAETARDSTPAAMAAEASPLLRLERLSVFYGPVRAVEDLTLSVDQGEIATLLGANGAGKSSTLNAIAGLAPRSRGQVIFAGDDITTVSTEMTVRRGLSLVPEGRRLFQNMTVRENLRLGAALFSEETFAATLAEFIDLFPIIARRSDALAGLLSGGEQQQVAIARALLSRPKLLLLDEPSLGLAPIFVGRVFEIIEELRRRGVTILLVEQNVERAMKIADHAYVLGSGRHEVAGAVSELAADEIEMAYLGIGKH